MKVKIFTVWFWLFSFCLISNGFGQVEVKKGVVTLNDKEVAQMNKLDDGTWEVFDANKKLAFKTNLKDQNMDLYPDKKWFELSSVDGSKKAYIPATDMILSLSTAKMIASFFSVNHNLFTPNGIDYTLLDKFFADYSENLSAKYNAEAEAMKAEELAMEQKRQEIVDKYDPSVDSDGTIHINTSEGDQVIGKIYTNNSMMKNFLVFYDSNDYKVASISDVSVSNNISETVTYDNKVFRRFFSSAVGSAPHILGLTIDLMAHGYTLGDQLENSLTDEEKAKMKEKTETVKTGGNLHGVNGTVYTDKEEYKGKIDLRFVPEVDESSSSGGNVLSVGGGPKPNVSVVYKNEKGKERTKMLGVEPGLKVVVDNDGKQDIYEGIQIIAPLVYPGSEISISLGKKVYFYQLINKGDKINLYKNPLTANTHYVIKLNNEDKGVLIYEAKNAKLFEKLGEYLSSCKVLADEIRFGGKDLFNEEDLKSILTTYDGCKK